MNRLNIFLLLTLLPIFGCQKEEPRDYFWEIQTQSNQTTIDHTVQDVRFKFALLNEAGKESTRFKAGENFTFLFEVTNNRRNRNEQLFFDTRFPSLNNNFLGVYTEDGEYLGEASSFRARLFVGPGAFPFYGEQKSYTVHFPWQDDRDRQLLEEFAIYFEGNNQSPLPKGKYYTTFHHHFRFSGKTESESELDMEKVDVGNLTFKINFEII